MSALFHHSAANSMQSLRAAAAVRFHSSASLTRSFTSITRATTSSSRTPFSPFSVPQWHYHTASTIRFADIPPSTPTPTPSTPVRLPQPVNPSKVWNPRSRADESQPQRMRDDNDNMLYYMFGIAVLIVGCCWAAVPLYRAFCAHTGFGGTTQQDKDSSKLSSLAPSKREITVAFNADVCPAMHWKFVPSQPHLKVKLGEPVLAFYKATNMREKGITGVATYNVTPLKAGVFFHKIQCFCFDEQRLRAKETVDMPVFFYIDPALEKDSRMDDVTDITLSYTFFPVDDDEDDTRSEAEKDAAADGVRLHTMGEIPKGMIVPDYVKQHAAPQPKK